LLGGHIVLSPLLFFGGIFAGICSFERLGNTLYIGLSDRRRLWSATLYLIEPLAAVATMTLSVDYWAAIRPYC
jgi:hypothetical protein